MAHLLHLSDLHLRTDPALDTVGDAKATAIPAPMQQTSSARISSTLEALARDISAGDLTIDCIIVSGDVADRGAQDAYDLLPQVLSPLVPALVPAERVVVVPGNHDVPRGSEPSSPGRWEAFTSLRSHGYVTPFLEGVDIDDVGTVLPGSAVSPVLTAKDGSFALVAMNSANHCQTQLPPEEELEPHLATLETLRHSIPGVEHLWEAWRKRGSVDPSWIGDGQQRAAAAALAAAASDVKDDAVRIVVMHHQLLPTATAAEIKSFETMINLGEVLDWIADNQVDLVLHGHKHSARVYVYEHTPFHRPDTTKGQRTVVISAPTARTGYEAGAAIARLISIDRLQPRTSGVVLRDVPSLESGGKLDVIQRPAKRYRLDSGVEHGRLTGQTAEQVHQQLLALNGGYSELPLPLICRIEDGASAAAVPASYPDIPDGIASPQQWFTETVAWWQRSRAGRSADFNHGQRLQAYRSSSCGDLTAGSNQLLHAAQSLLHKGNSSRAIAILVDPDTDLTDQGTKFPAFVLVQFTIDGNQLSATGYFRKQEMPHWWPINVAELHHLQNELLHHMPDRGLEPGSITTVTMQPVSGGGVPRVAIPSLDGRLDQPNGIVKLVLPLLTATTATREDGLRDWRQAFDDWAPSTGPAADGDPMPLLGLTALADVIEDLAKVYDTNALVALVDQLRLIATTCRDYKAASDTSRLSARTEWSTNVAKHRDRILELVETRLVELSTPA